MNAFIPRLAELKAFFLSSSLSSSSSFIEDEGEDEDENDFFPLWSLN